MSRPRAAYLVRFSSEEVAAQAILDSGIEPSDNHWGPLGEPIYFLDSGIASMDVHVDTSDRKTLWVTPGRLSYLGDWYFLNPGADDRPTPETLWWAEDILDGLKLLRSTPGLNRGAIFYGSDHQDTEDEFTPVDAAFMAALRKFIVAAP